MSESQSVATGVEAAPAPSRFVGTALAASIAAAAWLPFSPGPGLGIVLVVWAMASALWQLDRAEVGRSGLVYGSFALALAATAAVSDAGWLVSINLLAALILLAFALNPPESWLGVGRSLLAPAWRGLLVPVWLGRAAIRAWAFPGFTRLGGVAGGVAIGAALVVIFGAVFASADAAFAELLAGLNPGWDLGRWPARFVVLALVLFITCALALASLKPLGDGILRWFPDLDGGRPDRRRLWRAQWTTALGLLVVLFTVFVGVQVVVLFGGHDRVLSAADLTYAEYAREGFFQLVFAATLTVAVVAAFWNRAAVTSRLDGVLLKVLLGALCVLTLVILASALKRLSLYEQAFGLTRPRLSAHAFALWLGVVLTMLLVAGGLHRTRWLSVAVIVTAAAGLLAFGLLRPDAMIAQRNLERYEQTGKVDTGYLSRLSADAVPVLVEYRTELRKDVLKERIDRLNRSEPWSSANLSRTAARAALEDASLVGE